MQQMERESGIERKLTPGSAAVQDGAAAPPCRGGKEPVAWQPFTLKGVAAFAFARFARLFWIQAAVAALCSAAAVWFLYANWCPVIRSAVRALPDRGVIREQLQYPDSGSELLAENEFLGVLVRPNEYSPTSPRADVRVEFGSGAVRICSLFGCFRKPYPKTYEISFNPQEAVPWWQAWEPAFLGIVFVGVGLSLLLFWQILAALFFLPVRLIAYFKDRQLTLGGSWRLGGAAALPGAVFLAVAVVLYGTGMVDLMRFVLAVPLHLVVFLVYVFWSPSRLPRVVGVLSPAENPFTPPVPEKTDAGTASPAQPENPFTQPKVS